jgi:DNA-binding NarL/FixJ family response regulator
VRSMRTTDRTELRVAVAGAAELVEALRRELARSDRRIEVMAAGSSRVEAIARLQADVPDVCIVDRDLDGGGLIAAAAIALPRQPKVIVVGADTPAEQRAARLAGATASVPRDGVPNELGALVVELARKEQS